MNKSILMGRLTRDPEVRYSAGENAMAIARFTLAVNRRFRRDGEQNADFISCVAFGKTAEFIEKYITQGRQICISGRIQTTEVVVEEVDFADSRRSDNAAPAGAPAGAPANSMPAPESDAADPMGGFDVDGDIPFN